MLRDILHFLGCVLIALPPMLIMGLAAYTHPLEFAAVWTGIGIISLGMYLTNKYR